MSRRQPLGVALLVVALADVATRGRRTRPRAELRVRADGRPVAQPRALHGARPGDAEQGTSFDRYIVTDSLCCPSRASIFTGRYPHSTGVFTNQPPDGGFEVFHPVEEKSTFATSLQAAGYRTAMMGKYLNGYTPGGVVDGAPRFVPPGWSAWAVGRRRLRRVQLQPAGQAPGDRAAEVVHYGNRPQDYLTDVISRRGQAFIAGAVRGEQPFMLELATFAPHGPFTPAPRDADKFPNATVPRGPLFNTPQLRPRRLAADRPAHPAADRRLDRELPQARAVRPVRRQADRRHPREAARLSVANKHLHRVHLRQRLPHGPAPAAGGQADLLGSRHPRADGRRRAERARRRERQARWPRTSTCGPRSRSSRARRSAAARRGPQPGRLPARAARASWRNVTLVEHHGPTARRRSRRPGPAARATRRATRRCASPTRCTCSTTTRARPSTTTSCAIRTSGATSTARCRQRKARAGRRCWRACGRARTARPARRPTRGVGSRAMRAIQIVDHSGPESLQLADIDEPGGEGVVVDVRAAGVVLPRGAAVPRAVPDQAGPAVRARQRGGGHRARGRGRRSRPATASPRSACSAASRRSRSRPRTSPSRCPTARLRPGRRADPQLPHGVLRAEDARAPAPRARPCSCTAPPAASAPRRCRSPRASARGRSRSSRATRRSGRARGGRRRGRALRRRLEGRGEGARRRRPRARPGRRRPLHRQPALAARDGRLVVVGFTGGSIPEVSVNRLLLNNIEVVGAGWGAYIAQARRSIARDRRGARRADRGRAREADRRRALPARARGGRAAADRRPRGDRQGRAGAMSAALHRRDVARRAARVTFDARRPATR